MLKKNLLMEKPTPTCLVQWKSEGLSEIPIILGDVRVYINKKETTYIAHFGAYLVLPSENSPFSHQPHQYTTAYHKKIK